MTGLGKLLRGLIGLIVVAMLVVVLNSWWHEYRSAESAAKTETTSTATAATTTPAATLQKTVIVLTDGLNLRDKPDATGASIRGLKHGETYLLVGQIYPPGKAGPSAAPTWLQLRDSNGTLGWVTNNPQYVKIQK